MSQSVQKDTVVETHARHIGDAILFIGSDGTWFVGDLGQTISQYRQLKVNGQAVHDDSYECTALAVEKNGSGYTVYVQSNDDPNLFAAVEFAANGTFQSARVLSETEFYALETRLGEDLNESGGIGGGMVLVDDALADLYVSGQGAFFVKGSDGRFHALKVGDTPITWQLLGELEIEEVAPISGGYALIVRDDDDNLYQVEMRTDFVQPLGDTSGTSEFGAASRVGAITQLDAASATARMHNGQALGAAPTTDQILAAVAALRSETARVQAQQALANDGKFDYQEIVALMKAAVQATSSQGSLGADLFADLQSIAAMRGQLFTSRDLAGTESGYLAYVFDKLVNGSKANALYTGGNTTATNLGNLHAQSSADQLQKLVDKWLLGKDLPNPTTEGDTANPNAKAATGSYKAFAGELFVDGAQAYDVFQGNAGTCYLLAAAAAVAQGGGYVYRHIFVENAADSDGPTWGVRFFDHSGDAHWVTVNNQLVVLQPTDSEPAYAKNKGVNAQSQAVAELWVPLLEKAYAQANPLGFLGREKPVNAMYAIEGGLAEPIFYLTGAKTYTYAAEAGPINGNPAMQATPLPTGTTALAQLTNFINAGKVLWIGSGNQTTSPTGQIQFTGGHAYFAWDADPSNPSNTTVNVFNPWGYAPLITGAGHASPFQDNLVNLVGTSGYDFYFYAVA